MLKISFSLNIADTEGSILYGSYLIPFLILKGCQRAFHSLIQQVQQSDSITWQIKSKKVYQNKAYLCALDVNAYTIM